MKNLFLRLFIFIPFFSLAQNPLVKMWDKRFGGMDLELLTSFKQTSDGGYILGGWSNSGIGGDKTQDTVAGFDFWIIKIDSLGIKEWDKNFGGYDHDGLSDLQQTDDGGYVLGGWTLSGMGGDKSEPSKGGRDYWIIRIDSLGNKLWDRVFGGTGDDLLYSLEKTNDGGFIVGGQSFSGISGDKTEQLRDTTGNGIYQGDYWIVKIDPLGNKQWDKDFGGGNRDELRSLLQTKDGGYILGGRSRSGIGGDKTQNIRDTILYGGDYWVIKIDSLGVKQWDKDFGSYGDDWFFSLKQTSDDGYILGGTSFSGIGGDKSQPSHGYGDFWIVKIDSVGNKQWDKDFGGVDEEFQADNISQTSDHGYLISGSSYSDIGGDKTDNNLGFEQSWIVKTDSLANKQWDKTLLTGSPAEIGFAIQTRDGCYAMANYTICGIGGDQTQSGWGFGDDFWIIKFCDSTLATNISNIQNENVQLTLFPNPTTGKFKIQNNELKIDHIELFNTLGEIMKNVVFDCRLMTVYCQLLPPGIYIVRVTAGDKIFFQKIIKE